METNAVLVSKFEKVETDAVLVSEFEKVYRKINRLANMTLTKTRDQIKYNWLQQRQRKIKKHLGFDRLQKIKSFFDDKGTQAFSDEESDFGELPETVIYTEEIKKFIKVSGHIETPEEKLGSWTPI